MKSLLISVYALFVTVCFGQAIPDSARYLGQTPPGNTPKVFQLPVSSGLFAAERIAISPDGKEIYYTELNTYPPSTLRIKYFKYSNNQWSGPFNLFEGYMAPGLSLSGDTLFFQKNQNGSGTPYTYFSVRNDTVWSSPSKFMTGNKFYMHYLQITNFGNYYLSSNPPGSIGGLDWCRLVVSNTDTTIQSLGLPLNTSSNNADFYIAKNESFIISPIDNSSGRPMYISYHKNDGSWTNPKRLGSSVNFSTWNWGTYVSSDNKYLFFTTGTKSDYSDTYVYWVRIDSMIDNLKHTNFIPYVKNPIPNQTDTVGRSFNYQIPDSTFIDDDGNNTISYAATLSNGKPLPAWLHFEPSTRIFSGLPDTAAAFYIKVTATDTAKANISCTFRITVVNPTGVEENKERPPKELMLYQNYPDPFNPTTTIAFYLPSKSYVSLKIFDIIGREVATIISEEMSAGSYSKQWNAANTPSGVYFYRLQARSFSQTKKLVLLR
ncbi:MAG: putative Ig domain-containing protein [Bacteroidota bacterium]|jgi:hypothetical protein